MKRGVGATEVIVALLFVLGLLAAYRVLQTDVELPPTNVPVAAHEGLLYGRVVTRGGDIYEGRLRWGGDQEAVWGSYFNGFKDENPWISAAPSEQLPTERATIRGFGTEIAGWERPMETGRPFMARFGDIARIEPLGRDIRVTLKSGTTFELDRNAADDLADGLRVWDKTQGIVDLGERQIRSIELLPAVRDGEAPYPLYGTVVTQQGEFTGFVEWNRRQAVGSDELGGLSADGYVTVRLDSIASLARRQGGGSLVTLGDGREVPLPDVRASRGLYVDDLRYGRVLVSWEVFERVDFTPGGTGPAFDDFPPGGPLNGSVTTRFGRRITGRLVFDLDESEVTEMLDAPRGGVDYTILFGLIASIELAAPAANVTVTLHTGEQLRLQPEGDLAQTNGGMLIFADPGEAPDYVPWPQVERIDFDRPPAMYPPPAPSGTPSPL